MAFTAVFLAGTVSNKLIGNMSPVVRISTTSRVKKREQRHFSCHLQCSQYKYTI